MGPEVFISYAVEDRSTADAVCATLEARHTKCWIAPRDVLPGMDYAQAIVEAISQSRAMVLIFSSRSNHSPHVRREVERAVSGGIPILPFRIEDVPPSPSLEYYIGAVCCLDAFTPPLEGHLRRLATMMGPLVSRKGPVGERPDARYNRVPIRNVYKTAKAWISRPIVRFAAALAVAVAALAVVAVLVPIELPSGGDTRPVILPSTPTGGTATAAPVEPTPEAPELGTYGGTTSQGRPIEFDVVEGSRAIGRFQFDVEGKCPGCTCEVQREATLDKPAPIVDDAFSHRQDDFDVFGMFDSTTAASGYLYVHTFGAPGGDPPCDCGAVTWTASIR